MPLDVFCSLFLPLLLASFSLSLSLSLRLHAEGERGLSLSVAVADPLARESDKRGKAGERGKEPKQLLLRRAREDAASEAKEHKAKKKKGSLSPHRFFRGRRRFQARFL
jgi:hypothetical protein